MFALGQSDRFWWPVKFDMPGEDGKRVALDFDAQFKRVAHQRILDYLADTSFDKAVTLAREVVVGWRKVKEGTDDLQFSPENLERLLAIAMLPAALSAAFLQAHQIGREKN